MPDRLMTDDHLRDTVRASLARMGDIYFWRHRRSGVVYVRLGVTLREADLVPLVRYYPHGKRGFEFSRPVEEFLDRFEPTAAPLWTGT